MQTNRYGKTPTIFFERQEMETSSARRKRKLEWLCEQMGGYWAVAQKANLNPATLDQVLKGVLLPIKADGTRSPRALGNGTARAIELAYAELGLGWFDAADKQSLVLTDDEIDMVIALRQQRAARIRGSDAVTDQRRQQANLYSLADRRIMPRRKSESR